MLQMPQVAQISHKCPRLPHVYPKVPEMSNTPRMALAHISHYPRARMPLPHMHTQTTHARSPVAAKARVGREQAGTRTWNSLLASSFSISSRPREDRRMRSAAANSRFICNQQANHKGGVGAAERGQ